MDSFLVNRFWGDDKGHKEASNESERLQELLKKVKKRKRKESVNDVSDGSIKKITNQGGLKERLGETCTEDNKTNSSLINESDNNASIQNEDFTLIPKGNFKKKKKIKRVLPHWLANPFIIPVNLKHLTVTVDDIPLLNSRLVSRLKQNKITHFFPVQSKVIPWLLAYHCNPQRFWPQDACISTPTGSGKTLTYVLPIVQTLNNRIARRIRALVVVPTCNLATQVYKVFKRYVIGTRLKVIQLGNLIFEKEQSLLVIDDELENEGYRSLVDIVVTTPGRLIEHLLYTKNFCLEHLKFLVVDEADQMMESYCENHWLIHLSGRIPWAGETNTAPYCTVANVTSTPFRPQRLLFSATLSQDPEKLEIFGLFQPILFTSVLKSSHDQQDENIGDLSEHRGEFIGKYIIPNELDEYYTLCTTDVKPAILYYFIKKNNWCPVMCFVDTIDVAQRLTRLLHNLSICDSTLDKPIKVKEMSSKILPNDQKEIISQFRSGLIDILITTDFLARGIDILSVNCVILYDAPQFAKNYVHRVGRTGRAGKEGICLTILTPDQEERFLHILRDAGKTNIKKITADIGELSTLGKTYQKSLAMLRENVKARARRSKKIAAVRKGWKEKTVRTFTGSRL